MCMRMAAFLCCARQTLVLNRPPRASIAIDISELNRTQRRQAQALQPSSDGQIVHPILVTVSPYPTSTAFP